MFNTNLESEIGDTSVCWTRSALLEIEILEKTNVASGMFSRNEESGAIESPHVNRRRSRRVFVSNSSVLLV